MQPKELKHAPSLDGIRGVAIIVVLIFHLGWAWLPGGFLGVDVFFVLSGFLATTLLLEENSKYGTISLKRYFARRGLRLYPAIVALAIVSTIFTLRFNPEQGLKSVFILDAAVLSCTFNWVGMTMSGEWRGGMVHMWSLGVEVQFYLLWAVVVAVTAKRFRDSKQPRELLNALIIIAIAIAVGSSLWRAWLWSHSAGWFRMYYGTDTRLDGLLIGATAALLRLRWQRQATPCWLVKTNRWVISIIEAICSVVLIYLFATLGFTESHFGLVDFTLIGITTAALMLISVMRTDSILGALFRWSVLTWIGRISYSVYIWHMPGMKVLSAERLIAHGLPPVAAESVRFVAMILLGAASYYLLERTCMKLKRRFSPQGRAQDRALPENQESGLPPIKRTCEERG